MMSRYLWGKPREDTLRRDRPCSDPDESNKKNEAIGYSLEKLRDVYYGVRGFGIRSHRTQVKGLFVKDILHDRGPASGVKAFCVN